MKKNIILYLITVITFSIGSYYYGLKRGSQAGANAITFIFANQAVTQMNKHAMLLTTIKKGDAEWTEKLAEYLVEHDMQHLETIETLLLNIPTDENSEALIQSSLHKTKEMHKALKKLQ